MRSKNLRVTLIQADIKWEDIEWNLKKFMDVIVSDLPATDLIILPEYFTTGFTMNPHTFAVTMNSGPVRWMKSVVDEKQCAVTGALLIKENSKIYNRLIFIDVNRIGKDGQNISYLGNSLIYDPQGKIMARLTQNKEKTATFTFSLNKLNSIRKKFPVHLDADNFEIFTE